MDDRRPTHRVPARDLPRIERLLFTNRPAHVGAKCKSLVYRGWIITRGVMGSFGYHVCAPNGFPIAQEICTLEEVLRTIERAIAGLN